MRAALLSCLLALLLSGLAAGARAQCPAGTYRDTSVNQCRPCPVGTYNSVALATSCTVCPAPFTTSGPGSASASQCTILCSPGTYRSSAGTCVPCSPGSYQELSGQTTCSPCPIGTYQSLSGQSACSSCPAGTYQSAPGQVECPACPGGMYQPYIGQAGCYLCPSGTYQPYVGQAFCYSCSPGTSQPNLGQNTCSPCPPGTYANAGAAACTACAAGTSASAGSSTCTVCPTGSWSAAGSGTCVPCTSAIVFNSQPRDVSVVRGAPATFSVSASSAIGSAVFQWRRSGTTLADGPAVLGSRSQSLTLLSTTETDAGRAFDVIVTVGPCTARSDPAGLNVIKPCRADFDDNGTRAVDDIFAFLSAWFSGCP